MKQTLDRQIKEIGNEAKHWFKGELPSFVYQANRSVSSETNCPVFAFHSVRALEFKVLLEFLAVNRYETLSANTYVCWRKGEVKIPDRSVLLTFDDGRASLWTVVHPLLRKYGFRATAFVIPVHIQSNGIRPQWELTLPAEQVRKLEAIDAGSNPFITWEELRCMYRSGVIDVGCHSLKHHRVFVSDEIEDFWRPELKTRCALRFEWPVLSEHGNEQWMDDQPWGTPIYSHASRFEAARCYFDSHILRRASTQFVSENGGLKFFKRSGWQNRLRSHLSRIRTNDASFESEQERDVRIFDDLVSAKRRIEENLGNISVAHFAFPWGKGSRSAVERAREAGFKSIFWYTSKPDPMWLAGTAPDLIHVTRLKQDLTFRLPGVGRQSLTSLFSSRLVKRMFNDLEY